MVVIEDKMVVKVIFKMKWNLILNIEGNIYYNGDVFYLMFDVFEIY